jgi:predicted GH43/DUF377 family glycosyl hydrolase
MDMIYEIEGLPDERSFNNSICHYQGKLMMAYRAESPADGKLSQIKICELDPKTFKSRNVKTVTIPPIQPHVTLWEDPRLFTHKGELWMSFIAASYIKGQHWACQGIAMIGHHFQPDRIFYPAIGNNENHISTGNGKMTREKNWTFFSYDGEIHVIYSINPLKVGFFCGESGHVDFFKPTMVKHAWKWGELHGGTGLVEFNGLLVGCFHSFTREAQRNYHCGFYAIDPQTWQVAFMSELPWMSATYDNPNDKRTLEQSWRPNVVFPCGMIEHEDEFLISYGWQDCRSMLVKVKQDVVWNNLQPVEKHFQEIERYRDFSVRPPGGFKIKVGEQEIRAKGWQSLKRQVSRYGINERELEDAILKVVPAPYKRMEWSEIK